MRTSLLILMVLAGCALTQTADIENRIVYRSANGESLTFEHSVERDGSASLNTCLGHVCFGYPDCTAADLYCVHPFGSPALAVPKNMRKALPVELDCDPPHEHSWTFEGYAYRVHAPTDGKALCSPSAPEPVRFLGREIPAVKVTVHQIDPPDPGMPLATFLYSTSHGIVAIDQPSASPDGSRNFRTYWLESPTGLLHPYVERQWRSKMK